MTHHRLNDTSNYSYLFWPIVLIAIGAVAGCIWGITVIMSEIDSLNRGDKVFCGTGAWIITVYGTVLVPPLATGLGAMLGVIIALILFWRMRRGRKSDWEAYYGK